MNRLNAHSSECNSVTKSADSSHWPAAVPFVGLPFISGEKEEAKGHHAGKWGGVVSHISIRMWESAEHVRGSVPFRI